MALGAGRPVCLGGGSRQAITHTRVGGAAALHARRPRHQVPAAHHLVPRVPCCLQLSDWADGALARRLGCSSVLGSYLDPLGDKVLVGCVVAALAAQGALPLWVAGLVVGRDAALVGGMVVVRWRSLGWRVPWGAAPLTRAEFFRTAGAAQGAGGPGAVQAMPFMRPLLVSKVNTVLQLLLVGGCVSRAWVGWPEPQLLSALEASTAATTAASFAAYAWQYASGRLLVQK